MLFTADIGNTRASLCLWDESTGRKKSFIILDNNQAKSRTENTLKKWLGQFLKNKKTRNKAVFLISSVNPATEKRIISAVRTAAEKIPGLKTSFRKISTQDIPLPIKYKGYCGIDRLAAAFGAFKETGKNALIVNSGTACCIDLLENGVFCGGAILPGPETMRHSLNNLTAGIKVKALKQYALYPGRDTAECVSAGIRQGMSYILKGFVNDIRKRKKNIPVILTGGKAGMFPVSIVPGAVYIPDLVHRGLFHLFPLVKRKFFSV